MIIINNIETRRAGAKPSRQGVKLKYASGGSYQRPLKNFGDLTFKTQYCTGFAINLSANSPPVSCSTSEDPIKIKRGLNLFEFVRNNALNLMDPLGLYWEYCQATGRLYYNNITTGQRTFTGTGYSGCGAGLNNPGMQGVGDVGPIPQGYWTIGPMRNSIRTGPHVLDLFPKPETDLFERENNFQIHGNNTCDDQSASRGCIVLDRAIRDTIAQSCDDLLWVTE